MIDIIIVLYVLIALRFFFVLCHTVPIIMKGSGWITHLILSIFFPLIWPLMAIRMPKDLYIMVFGNIQEAKFKAMQFKEMKK